jgi:hypothetical protein
MSPEDAQRIMIVPLENARTPGLLDPCDAAVSTLAQCGVTY